MYRLSNRNRNRTAPNVYLIVLVTFCHILEVTDAVIRPRRANFLDCRATQYRKSRGLRLALSTHITVNASQACPSFYRYSDKHFDFLTWQEVMSERNMIINSSPNSKHEHACNAIFMGVIVTAISQSRGKSRPPNDEGLYVTAISQSRGKSGR